MEWNYVLIGVACVIVLGFAARYICRRKNRHVGLGWMLGWDQKTGGVYVLSRLIKSPSGRAGVSIGSRLSTYKKKELVFASSDEFLQWAKSVRHYFGQSVEFSTEDSGGKRKFTLQEEVIQGPIPVYPQTPGWVGDDSFTHGLAYCPQTGQWVPTTRISDQALTRAFK